MREIKTSQKGVDYAPPQTLKTKKRVYSQALLMKIPHDHEGESDISLKIGRYTLGLTEKANAHQKKRRKQEKMGENSTILPRDVVQ